jgi:hypothetical protein
MAWSRFEPGFSRHPKRIKVGPVASWLWIASVDHCTEFRTDGFLDDAAVATLCPMKPADLKRHVGALVGVRSWERVEGGYLVHGYLEHNQSARQIEADRQISRDRYRRWWQRVNNGVSNAVSNAVGNGVGPPFQTPFQTDLSVSQSVSHKELLEPPEVSTRSPTKRARRAQTGAPGIAHAIDSALDPAHVPRESTDAELQIIATALKISIEEVRERQAAARRGSA